MKLHHWLLIIISSLLSSCFQDREQPVTNEEALAFARQFEKALASKDFTEFDRAISGNAFIKRIAETAGKKMNSDYMNGVREGLRKNGFSKEIARNIGADGSYTFIRHYEKDNKQHVLFRLYSEQGLNYHDFELVKLGGKVEVADIFIYLSGENLSQTIASTMAMLLNYAKDAKTAELEQQISAMRKIKFLVGENDHAAAKEAYNKLPQKFRDHKMFQIMNLQITAQLDHEEYKAALDEFEAKYGNDASVQLSLLDAYIMNNNYEKLLNAINIMDKSVQDPRLNLYRGIAYKQLNEKEKATQCLEQLYKDEPDFEDGALELLTAYMELKQYKKARGIIADYRGNRKFDQSNLELIDYLYPEFAAQKE